MKFGKLRTDDDAHWYLVPEELVDEYDAALNRMMDIEPYTDAFEDACREFDAEYGQYRLGGSPYELKVVMPDG